MRTIQRGASAVILSALMAACGASAVPPPAEVNVPPPAPPAASSVEVAAPAPPVPSADPAPAPVGWMDAPGNDPDVVKLAQEALTCPWLEVGFSDKCAPMKAWDAEEKRFKDGRADATLVSMLDSPDHPTRLIAVRKLDRWGKRFRSDRALAERVVAAAERERFSESDLAARLGSIVGTIDVVGMGLVDRVAAIAKDHPLKLVRSYLVADLPKHNPTSAEVRKIVEGAIDDSTSDVRVASARAYQYIDAGAEESCAFWAAHLDHSDVDVVGACVSGLAEDRCARYHGKMLAALARSNAVFSPWSSAARALESFCKGSTATGPERSQAAALARQVVEKGIDVAGCIPVHVREEALDAVVACDPRGAKAYVRRFVKDPREEMRQRAAAILRGL